MSSETFIYGELPLKERVDFTKQLVEQFLHSKPWKDPLPNFKDPIDKINFLKTKGITIVQQPNVLVVATAADNWSLAEQSIIENAQKNLAEVIAKLKPSRKKVVSQNFENDAEMSDAAGFENDSAMLDAENYQNGKNSNKRKISDDKQSSSCREKILFIEGLSDKRFLLERYSVFNRYKDEKHFSQLHPSERVNFKLQLQELKPKVQFAFKYGT